ncbi:DUF4386 domain-containing protein [Methanolobus sp. WCC4]|uniref:DUF4386 domain-containing protein n=1 Tax=Methanolobus sp. WCC4 TaxID=3125784 RepID=UPI0030F616E7
MKEKIESNRMTAIIVGILFIFAIVMLFLGESLYRPILDSPDYLDNAYPNKVVVVTGILLEFTGVPAVVFLSVLLFPILRRYNEALALGYVVFRLFEAALLSVAYISKLSMINLSQNYLSKGSVDTSYFQYIGGLLQSFDHWAGTQGTIYHVAFVIGSMILYYTLYRSKLVPRPISAWGFFAAIALLTGSVLSSMGMFAETSEIGLELVFALPIAVAEIMLSIWLIVKGFNPSAIASMYAGTDSGEI